ncbi:MAG: hypothetical protein AAGC67_19155 [Myxococcota bacterium]
MVHPAEMPNRFVAIVALVAASFALASAAEARLETLRWTHPRTDALDFEVRIRTLSSGATQVVSLGLSGRPLGSEYVQQVEVGDGDVELQLRAIGPGSDPSAWNTAQLRTGAAAPPDPDPEPDPDPTVDPGPGSTIPPTVGAAVRFDFSDDAPGTNVQGWVDTRANYSLSVDDALFTVLQTGANRVLHTDSTANAIHAHATSDVRSNFEVRGRMAIDHPDAEIGVTTYSRYPSEDVYYRIGRESGESIRFVGRPGVVCANADSGVTPEAGQWIRFELDVRDEGDHNRVIAKVWPASSSEPATPQIDCVDNSANRPRQGSVGVWAGGIGSKFWDDFEIFQGVSGGGGAPAAPLPPLLIQIVPLDN